MLSPPRLGGFQSGLPVLALWVRLLPLLGCGLRRLWFSGVSRLLAWGGCCRSGVLGPLCALLSPGSGSLCPVFFSVPGFFAPWGGVFCPPCFSTAALFWTAALALLLGLRPRPPLALGFAFHRRPSAPGPWGGWVRWRSGLLRGGVGVGRVRPLASSGPGGGSCGFALDVPLPRRSVLIRRGPTTGLS